MCVHPACAAQEQPDWSWDKCFVELRARVTDAIKVGGPLWEPRTAAKLRAPCNRVVLPTRPAPALLLPPETPAPTPFTSPAAQAYHAQHGLPSPTSIVDMGCSTGLSTRWLAAQFPQAQVTGLDLSPYFLAVAELERRRAVAGGPPAPSQQVGERLEGGGDGGSGRGGKGWRQDAGTRGAVGV